MPLLMLQAGDARAVRWHLTWGRRMNGSIKLRDYPIEMVVAAVKCRS
jgi:hypothetical protein